MASGDDLSAVLSEFQKAVAQGNNKRIKKLIEDNETLLYDVTKKNLLHLVRQMLEHGAKVNASNDKGVTPLHVAAQHASKEVVSLLLQHGAMIDAVDDLSTKAVDVAKNKEISDLLIATEKLHESVLNNNSTEVQKQLKAGAVVNARNSEGNTPLHNAAMKGLDGMVKILLDKNANVNMHGSGGFTALHYAAKMSQVIIAKSLLFHGAIFEALNDKGKTPSDICMSKVLSKLFKLIKVCFDKIEKDDETIMIEILQINDEDIKKAVLGAKNKDKRTLMLEGMHGKFSKLEQFRLILQPNVSKRVVNALTLMHKGKYLEALDIYRGAFKERLQLLGPNNPLTLEVQSDIAQALYKLGTYPEAMNIYKEVSQRQTELFGFDAKETLHTRSNMALILHRQEKGKEALPMFEEVYKKQLQLLGPDDEQTIGSLFHKAVTLDGLKRHDEALEIYMSVYEKRKKALGPDHMATVYTQNNIAMVLYNLGKYKEALEIYKEVLQKKKKIMGINHGDVIRTLHNIAMVLTDMNRHPEAIKTYEEVLKVQKNIFPPNHPELLSTKYNLANLLFSQKKSIHALRLYKEILEPFTVIHGQHHRQVTDIVQKIGLVTEALQMAGTNEQEVLEFNKNGLRTAIVAGNLDHLNFFLNTDADVNEKDSEGRTSLHFAISYGHLEILKALLGKGADVTLATTKGNTPLHTAVLQGSTAIVQVLLQHARRHTIIYRFIDAQTTSTSTTALHVAARKGMLDIAKLLLKYGATYQMINKDGQTPLGVATDPKVNALLKLIEDVFEDLKVGSFAANSKLRSLKPDEILPVTNARNLDGNTLMTVATDYKRQKIVGLLNKMVEECNDVVA